MAALFLDAAEVALLTGFQRKSRQIAQLRRMGIAFWVNAAGRPVVCRAALEGLDVAPKPRTWTPAITTA